ncbi:hypothetical protein GXB85_07885 [Cellulomonas sp. APG4]|uniref:hypothetical protein n=1 Tax=Cellulomonas sp. APG4 TaxID=1538656 RepID=UPI001379AA8D|nr:hypothetical protein [Cellulomonas sp. APG4]NCT90866.1 hypothetical protein [Cellulomonas sp. APG4]
MRRLLQWRLGARAEGDEGIAMVMIIGVSMVLTLLAVAGVGYALSTTQKARNDQDWSGALAAAYAGVEEYQSRLANDPSYLTFGNPASPFSSAAGATVALPETTGGAVNPAFSLTDWAEVPGSAGTSHFRYEVDNSDYYTDGTLRLRATGRVGEEVRTVVADLRQKGFIDFLYFTDFETQDPEVSRQTDDTVEECSVYEYHGRSSDCTTIQFGGFDEIDGPLHTNDTMYICGARFLGFTTSSYKPTSGLRYKKPGGCANPFFKENGAQPDHAELLPMPKTNTELRKETRSDLPVEVPNPGCLYTGPTSIQLESTGKMRVRSPWTRATSPNGANNAGCGTPGPGGLGSSSGQLIDVPLNTVVFVQNVPNVVGDPNYWSPTAPGQPSCAAGGNPVGYPASGEAVRYTDAYGCRNGDLFIKGVLDGHVTMAAENYIYVTGDIRYANPNEDILGLVGQNAVWVMNPVKTDNVANNVSNSYVNSYLNAGYDCVQTSYYYNRCTSYELLGGWAAHRRIDAAILSVAHTFMVQNYDRGGSRGTLTINGAIAQKFRGTVATSGSGGGISTGYAKDYNYDKRLRDTAPPKFLSPAVITYGVTQWTEVDRAFNPDGTAA